MALHGCAGLFDKHQRLKPRELQWGKYLSENGFVVLYPDSFTTRKIEEICTRKDTREMSRSLRPRDSYGALRWLQNQKFVDANRTALMGWSNGGSSLLWAIGNELNFFPSDLRNDFRFAIAIYPGCNLARRKKDWTPRMPLEIHIGADDDWADPQQCRAVIEKSGSNSASITLYPKAHHDFDAPNLPMMTKKNLAYPTKHGNFATIGTNEKAREELMQNVLSKLNKEFLARSIR